MHIFVIRAHHPVDAWETKKRSLECILTQPIFIFFKANLHNRSRNPLTKFPGGKSTKISYFLHILACKFLDRNSPMTAKRNQMQYMSVRQASDSSTKTKQKTYSMSLSNGPGRSIISKQGKLTMKYQIASSISVKGQSTMSHHEKDYPITRSRGLDRTCNAQ